MTIVVRAIGNGQRGRYRWLATALGKCFGAPVSIGVKISDVSEAYDGERKQYLAERILSSMAGLGMVTESQTLGVTEFDLYAPGLNFVFGQADMEAGVAIISLCRLRPEYYGLPGDENLFRQRAIKEAVHELGHTAGLRHCADIRCVMHFSNSLADTDWKSSAFCPKCSPRLIKQVV
jgi:archaemetzincin